MRSSGGSGFLALCVVLFGVIAQGLRVALEAPEPFGRVLAAGLTALLGIEIAGNLCVCLGLLPTTGLALPFLSYGGSSAITTALALGLVVAVDRARRPNALAGRVGPS